MSVIKKEIQSAGQKLVSGDKYRYRAEGFDLDLTYILPRIIAMGVPGEGIEKTWRNDINAVARFLNTKHGPNYRIFNLTGEEYDYQKFNNQVVDHFDFPDHHPPCMKMYLAVIKAMDEWMVSNPENVAVVHCLAGRSRTGCVIAGYFMYSSLHGTATSPPLMKTAKEAITFFNAARSEEGQNIVLPSQVRWVNYFEKVLYEKNTDIITNPPKYLLKTIRIYPPPLVEVGKKKAILTPITCVKYLAESAKDSRAPITEVMHPQIWHDDPPTDLKVNAEVAGDIEIIFYHNAKNTTKYAATMNNMYSKFLAIQLASHYPRVPLFRCIFNTAFLTGDKLVVTPEELDAPLAGPVVTNQYIPKNMRVEFTFEKISDTSTTPVPVLDSSQISSQADLVPTSVFKSQMTNANPNASVTTSSVTETNYSAPASTSTIDPIQAALNAVSSTNLSLPSRVASMASTKSDVPTAPSRPQMPAPANPPITKQPPNPQPTSSPSQSEPPSPSPRRSQLTGEPLAPGMALLANVTAGVGAPGKSLTPSPTRNAHIPVGSPVVPGARTANATAGGSAPSKSPTPSPNRNDHIPVGTPIVNSSAGPFATSSATHQRTSSELNVPSVTARRKSDPSKPVDPAHRPLNPYRNHFMSSPPGQLPTQPNPMHIQPQPQFHPAPLPPTLSLAIPQGVQSSASHHSFPTIPNLDPTQQTSPSPYPGYPPAYPRGLQLPHLHHPVGEQAPYNPYPTPLNAGAYPYPDPSYGQTGGYPPHLPYSYPNFPPLGHM